MLDQAYIAQKLAQIARWMTFKGDNTTSVCSKHQVNNVDISGVARAFPGGRLAHPEGQNEEENKWSLRTNKKNWSKFEEKMRKVELLPTRDGEAGYGPGEHTF